jgi:hypothetical protein
MKNNHINFSQSRSFGISKSREIVAEARQAPWPGALLRWSVTTKSGAESKRSTTEGCAGSAVSIFLAQKVMGSKLGRTSTLRPIVKKN